LYTLSSAHLVADVFGYFAPASASSAGRLQPMVPGRLLDTRAATLIGYSGGEPAIGATVPVAVLGREGVPASGVSAVVLNVTATDTADAGFVTAWPQGDRPTVSSLNLDPRDPTIANQVVVPIGADGNILLYTLNAAQLIVDVTGYYTDSTAPQGTTGLFIPVSPYRAVDTRTTAELAAGSTMTLLAAADGTAAAGMSGLAMNVTATQPAAPGFVTVWPQSTRPTASSVNFTSAGQTIPNHVTSATGDDGGVRLFTLASADLVVDVIGWYR
jgi:hypothetical protein